MLTDRAHPAVREAGSAEMPSPPRRDTRERELLSAYGQLGDANEVLNERAVAVMKRMSDKLTGRDFLQVGTQWVPRCNKAWLDKLWRRVSLMCWREGVRIAQGRASASCGELDSV